MRAMGVVFNQPVGQVEVACINLVKANVRQGKPFILEGPVKTFEARVVLGLADAREDVLDVEQQAGFFKLTGELAAIVRMDTWQVTLGQQEQALEEISCLAGGTPGIDAGKGETGAVFEGGKDVTWLAVPAQVDGIGVP